MKLLTDGAARMERRKNWMDKKQDREKEKEEIEAGYDEELIRYEGGTLV